MPDIVRPIDWFSASSRVMGTIPNVGCGRPEPRFVSISDVERSISVAERIFAVTCDGQTHSRPSWKITKVFSLGGFAGTTSLG